MEIGEVTKRHNSFVDKYLASTLGLSESRSIRMNDHGEEKQSRSERKSLGKLEYTQQLQNPEPDNSFKLPKVPFS